MKELLRTIQHRAGNKGFEIRIYCEGEILTVEAYHGDELRGEPQAISTAEDTAFRTYHGESAVDGFIRSFIDQIDRGLI